MATRSAPHSAGVRLDWRARLTRWAVAGTCATLVLLLSPAVGAPSEGLLTSTNPNASVISTATLQPPTGLASSGAAANTISLFWTPSSSSFAVSTEVYRSGTSGGPYVLLTTLPTATSVYADSGLAPNTPYYYVLRTVAGSWLSAYSAQHARSTTP